MKLNENEKAIYRYLVTTDITQMSAQHVACKLFVSRTAIYRVCQKMGYRSFTHLKYVKEQKVGNTTEIQKVDSTELFKHVFDSQLVAIIEKLLQAHVIYIFGTHATSVAAQYLCRQLINLDCLAVRITDEFELTHIQHRFTTNDVILCLSASGQNPIITKAIPHFQAESIAITKHNSAIALACPLAITFDFPITTTTNSFDRENIFPLIVIVQKLLINIKNTLEKGV
ncbi:MAG: MurR/RpiR family transcriptional regulator [Culicoidibacterales bacterium]